MLRNKPLAAPETLTETQRKLLYPEFPPGAEAYARETTSLLVPAELIAAAKAATGLDDFGPEPLAEPLEILCKSINEEIVLSDAGFAQTTQELVGGLSTRLRLVDLWRRKPEILELPVERPVFIVGLPRSGTTILHKLLGEDPDSRRAPMWEQIMPLPLGPVDGPDPDPGLRLEYMRAGLEQAKHIAPDMLLMHDQQPDEPDEDIFSMIPCFSSMYWEWALCIEGFPRYYVQADHTAGYLWFRKFLQTLQWLRGGRNWVLKAPSHMENLVPLVNAFPDATLVMTHRDPVSTCVSLSSLTTYGQRNTIAHPDPLHVGQACTNGIERLLKCMMRDRPRFESQFVDVRFPDLLADPIAVARRIIEASGREFTPAAEAALRAFQAANPPAKHGAHRYIASDFGLDAAELRERFRFYTDAYDIALEGIS